MHPDRGAGGRRRLPRLRHGLNARARYPPSDGANTGSGASATGSASERRPTSEASAASGGAWRIAPASMPAPCARCIVASTAGTSRASTVGLGVRPCVSARDGQRAEVGSDRDAGARSRTTPPARGEQDGEDERRREHLRGPQRRADDGRPSSCGTRHRRSTGATGRRASRGARSRPPCPAGTRSAHRVRRTSLPSRNPRCTASARPSRRTRATSHAPTHRRTRPCRAPTRRLSHHPAHPTCASRLGRVETREPRTPPARRGRPLWAPAARSPSACRLSAGASLRARRSRRGTPCGRPCARPTGLARGGARRSVRWRRCGGDCRRRGCADPPPPSRRGSRGYGRWSRRRPAGTRACPEKRWRRIVATLRSM